MGAGTTPRYLDLELPQIGPDDEFKVIITKLSTQVQLIQFLLPTTSLVVTIVLSYLAQSLDP